MSLGKRGEPWFDDGNIILVTDEDKTAFRLHRGVLGRHSEVFEDMFCIPQPVSHGTDIYDGCQVVCVYDLPSEFSTLITALYDGATFHNRNFDDFLNLVSILRLSTKYFIAHLRIQAIRFLAETWSYTLHGHDAMVARALTSPVANNTTYPYVHPLHILNLAREVNIQIVVPSALYFLSLYPLIDLLRADHPKLQSNHPSTPSSVLDSADIKDYTLMFQHRMNITLDFVRRFFDKRPALCKCPTTTICIRGFSKLSSRLSRSWVLRTGPLHFMVQAIQVLREEPIVCQQCRVDFERDVNTLREAIWKDLPTVVGLAGWDQLEAVDLSS
ncbi:hypothetical protein BDZ94DRAFT_1309134 [Collybia nuda]|uniref:BTB domain-containing protein n=1 Tax=Collybia nuda TaxID=64659 RepID=A0A9P5Y8C1_9AGAR|nr:hypothetical protein BDZ94DRAFT_1309134 [Collybia nuda]